MIEQQNFNTDYFERKVSSIFSCDLCIFTTTSSHPFLIVENYKISGTKAPYESNMKTLHIIIWYRVFSHSMVLILIFIMSQMFLKTLLKGWMYYS